VVRGGKKLANTRHHLEHRRSTKAAPAAAV
jgi:hypothetical protein